MKSRKKSIKLAYERVTKLAEVTQQVQKEYGIRYRTIYPHPPELIPEIMKRFKKVDPFKKGCQK